MNAKICLFHDYLSDISPREKAEMLSEMSANVIEHGERPAEERQERRFGVTSNIRTQYRDVVMETRRRFGRYAPNALSAMIRAHGETEWARAFSQTHRQFFRELSEIRPEEIKNIPVWAMDPYNWFLVGSETGSYELQTQVSSMFPCTIFENVPLECSTTDPAVTLENLDEIMRVTGIYQAWQSGNLGEHGRVAIFDTGVTDQVKGQFSIQESAVGGLTVGDTDGHGTAVAHIILALAPNAKVESIKVMKSYTESTIWNLISGLSSLYKKPDYLANVSLGVNPLYVSTLGPGAVSFRESLTHLVSSASSQRCFIISAAGNDASPHLRWPAAAPDALAVGAHNAAATLSTFSNFSESAQNFILTPGGELRSEDQKLETFGKYGMGHSREIYGTSFSCAVASGVSAILQGYSWFTSMDIPSRISLYRNHCRRNKNGFPILNIADIGAVWPL
jgi:subtilisin family serine protease